MECFDNNCSKIATLMEVFIVYSKTIYLTIAGSYTAIDVLHILYNITLSDKTGGKICLWICVVQGNENAKCLFDIGKTSAHVCIVICIVLHLTSITFLLLLLLKENHCTGQKLQGQSIFNQRYLHNIWKVNFLFIQ